MRLIESFRESIKYNKLAEFAGDYGEVTIDSIIDNDFLKNIPIIKGVIALIEIKESINQKHTAKKIMRFLEALNNIADEERENFLNDLAKDRKEETSVFENLLIILDRLDKDEKAFIIGNLFKLHILKIISREKFFRLASIVERAYLADLLALHSVYNHRLPKAKPDIHFIQSQKEETKIALVNLGLLKEKEVSMVSKSSRLPIFSVTRLGNDLAHMLYYKEGDIFYLRNSHNSYK